MIISFCSDIKQFHHDRLKDRNWSKLFLGSAWVTSLYERSKELGVEVASGDICIQKIQSGEWRASDVLVVQEIDARHGIKLCGLGAVPFVLMVPETPMVAFRGIDKLRKSRQFFHNFIGPQPIFESIAALKNTQYHPLFFPSYWATSQLEPVPWEQRKHTVLIAANKYWRERKWNRVENANDIWRALKQSVRKFKSKTYREYKDLQLHDARIDLLQSLGLRGEVDVYGRGWNDLSNLPKAQLSKLQGLNSIFKGECDNKHEILSQYRFTIAYENTAYSGFITEKIVDAMVARTVPIYLGAPDISTQIPPTAFIDARKFSSPEKLVEHLDSMTSSDAQEIINAGQSYLKSLEGIRHTYEGFSDWIIRLAGKSV